MIMPTSKECICCCEVERVVMKKEVSTRKISCTIDYEGFDLVCLNVWVRQAAYFSYRHHYGDAEDKDIRE